MMKALYMLAVHVLILSGMATAQNDVSGPPDKLVGLNAASLWLKSDEYIPAISGQFKIWEKLHFRAQIGFNGSNLDGDQSSRTTNAFFSNGTIDSTRITNPHLDDQFFCAAGLNWITQINPQVGVYFGAEYIFNQRNRDWNEDLMVVQDFQQNNRTTFHTVTEYETRTNSSGFGIMAGAQYQLGKRLVVGLETGFQFIRTDYDENRSSLMTQWSAFNPQIFTQENSSRQSNRTSNYGFNPLSGAFIYLSL